MLIQNRIPISENVKYFYSTKTVKVVTNKPDKSSSTKLGYKFKNTLQKWKKHEKSQQIFWLSLVLWIFASLGLIYQVTQVSSIYFAYPTRIEMEIVTPHWITMPSLTFCMKLISYNTSHPTFGPYLTKLSKYKSNNQMRSVYAYLPIDILWKMNWSDVQVSCLTPWPELRKLNQSKGYECENFVEPFKSIQHQYEDNLVYKCLTYFNQKLGQPEFKVINKNAGEFYRIKINSKVNHTIAIFVHSPHEVQHINEADTFRFWTGDISEMTSQITKMWTNLLPSPYATDCYNYSLSKINRGICINLCRLNLMQKSCNVWPSNIPAAIPIKLPFRLPDRFCPFPDTIKCIKKEVCKNSCSHVWYTTTLISSKEKHGNSTLTYLYVRRPFGAEITYNYVPRMELIEFLCYIASLFGIWFGFSFADIVRYTLGLIEKRSIEAKNTVNFEKRREHVIVLPKNRASFRKY